MTRGSVQRFVGASMRLLLLVLLCPHATWSAFTITPITDGFEVTVQDVLIFRHTPDSPTLFGGNGETEFVESKGNFRIEDYVTSRVPLVDMQDVTNGSQIRRLKFTADDNHYVTVELSEDDLHPLVLDVVEMQGFDRLWLRVVAEVDEHVYGGGAQFSYFDLRHRSYPIWTREQGVGRNKSTLTTFYSDQKDGAGGDYHTTYFPQPTFLSSRNYYMHHSGSNYAVLDFSHDLYHEVLIKGTPGRVHVQTGANVSSLVGSLTHFLGRQPPLPAWIMSGAILGIQGGTAKMLDYITQAEEHGVEVAAVWIQDWVGRITTTFGRRLFWDWHWNEEQYPDLRAEVQRLKQRGIRVLTYINPYLNFQGDLFKEADKLGYFVKNDTNQTFVNDFGEFFCGTIDLTNPDAYQWYKNEVVIKNMIDMGFSGWMADFGEYLPIHGVHFHSGQTAEELHNVWPAMWARLNREAVEETNNLGDVVFWMRAGWTGSGNYTTLLWAGDQDVDWSLSDGLASTITGALSAGLSGVALTHYDIGGFTTFAAYDPPLVRTEELLLRSAEMAVFTPVFRTHEGNQPTASVQYYDSEGTLKKFARLTRMFAAMFNYTSHVVNMSSQTGWPAQSPLFLYYPSDAASYDIKYQYMYGPDLLVAPVYLPDTSSWDVYLPPDPEASWVFLWNASMVSAGGQWVKVAAPLGRPPVFYRQGSDFVDVFHRVSAEPLVNLPEYIPESQQPSTPATTKVQEPSTCSGSRSSARFMFAVLMVAVSWAWA